ncbi:hypothetical protein INT45_011152 [Circinella minor]|uniref:Uncharacterized protein n=1 Tax=Circinella minor TaxID=1195481 RepID=A0A8H7SGZ2_9FUNG|nr:hypothetical protein INT45_011152 [Circinella minor]
MYFCHGCYQVKAETASLGRNTPDKTCDACRGCDTPRRVIPFDGMVFLDSLDEESHGINEEFHQPNDQGMYTFTSYVCIDPELELMGDRQVMDWILDVVGQERVRQHERMPVYDCHGRGKLRYAKVERKENGDNVTTGLHGLKLKCPKMMKDQLCYLIKVTSRHEYDFAIAGFGVISLLLRAMVLLDRPWT